MQLEGMEEKERTVGAGMQSLVRGVARSARALSDMIGLVLRVRDLTINQCVVIVVVIVVDNRKNISSRPQPRFRY